jgi:hypothetical protein
MTHTPGPWHIQQTGSPGFFTVKGVNFKPVTMQGPTGEANARLMAAGPALLTLAYQFAQECGDCAGTRICPDDEPCTQCRDIWDVIATAGGGTSLPFPYTEHWDAETFSRWEDSQRLQALQHRATHSPLTEIERIELRGLIRRLADAKQSLAAATQATGQPDPIRVLADLLDFWQRFEPDVFDQINHYAMEAAKALAYPEVTGSRACESEDPQP